MYMRLLNFFITMKKQRLEKNLMPMNKCQKFSIAIAYVLGVLGLYATIIQLFYLYIQYVYQEEVSDAVKLGHDIERKIVWPITDFFMAVAILYLFYQFGLRKLQSIGTVSKTRSMSTEIGISSPKDNSYKPASYGMSGKGKKNASKFTGGSTNILN